MKHHANDKDGSVRNKVLAVATQLIALKGYSETAVKEIADKSGCASSLIYYQFKQGKMEIFLSIIIEYWQEIIQAVRRELALSFNPTLSIKIIIDQLFFSLTNGRTSRLRANVLAEVLSDKTADCCNEAIREMLIQIANLTDEFNKIFSMTIEAGQDQDIITCDLAADMIRDVLIGSIKSLARELSLQECGFRKAGYTIRDAKRAYGELLTRFINK